MQIISKMDEILGRRKFIYNTGIAALGSIMIPKFSTAANPQKKVRVGVVGGRFGLTFHFHLHPNSAVEAVSDLIPDRRDALMKTYKCSKSYNSLEELIKDPKVDAVAIFTGVPDHAKHTLACLNAGKHVLCAVPAAYTIDECYKILRAVKKTGLTYMMAETSYYNQQTIAARELYKKGAFGNILGAAAHYYHPGLEVLFWDENKKRTWRYGLPPIHYCTHSTSRLISITGDRLAGVSCLGWGDDSPILKDNIYKNPFWKETAFFKTKNNLPFEVGVLWRGAIEGTDRGEIYGDKLSFYDGYKKLPTHIIKATDKFGVEEGGFAEAEPEYQEFTVPEYWKTDMLPAPLRRNSGHRGSHTFLTHEFIDSIVNNRKPVIDIYESLAYTAPGIIAHKSALKNGEYMKIPDFDDN